MIVGVVSGSVYFSYTSTKDFAHILLDEITAAKTHAVYADLFSGESSTVDEMFVRWKAFVAVEVLKVPAWVITSDFYLHDASQQERTQSWFGAWSTAGWNEARKIGLRVTLAVKGDGRPASVLPLSSWPSGSVQALYNVCACISQTDSYQL